MTTFGELACEVCGISGRVVAMHRANPTDWEAEGGGEHAPWCGENDEGSQR